MSFLLQALLLQVFIFSTVNIKLFSTIALIRLYVIKADYNLVDKTTCSLTGTPEVLLMLVFLKIKPINPVAFHEN